MGSAGGEDLSQVLACSGTEPQCLEGEVNKTGKDVDTDVSDLVQTPDAKDASTSTDGSDVEKTPASEPLCPEKEEEKNVTDVSDLVGLARMVCNALLNVEGYGAWGRLAASDVEVKDISGWGGSKTFMVKAQVDGLSPQTVILHARPKDHGRLFMRRMEAAQAALSAAGIGPLRLAGGKDWWVETYVGPDPKKKQEKVEKKERKEGEEDKKVTQQRMGELLARVHKVGADWFQPLRAELCARDGRVKQIAEASFLWVYLSRGCFGAGREDGELVESPVSSESLASDKWTGETLKRYGDMTPFESRIPFCNRIVTLHGDFHRGNLLSKEHDADGPLWAGVTDFEFTCAGSAICDLGFACGILQPGAERSAFLRGYLEESGYGDEAEIEAALPTLLEDVSRAKMWAWVDSFKMEGWEVENHTSEKIEAHVKFVHEAALDLRDGKRTKEEIRDSMREQAVREALPKCAVHKKEQEALEKAVEAAKDTHSPGETAKESEGADAFFMYAAADTSLVLAKAPGCNRLWLEEVKDAPSMDAVWRLRSDGRVVHSATGLFLTTPVKYPFTEREMPWDASLTPLELAVEEEGAAQLWCHEWSKGAVVIRHVVDGRVVAPNFVEVAAGRGVNANVADVVCAQRRAHCWNLRPCDGGECADFCELPAAGKWQPLVDGGGGRALAAPESIVSIRCEEENDFCLGVVEGKVKCVDARVREPECVRWRVVGSDQLQHLASGLFLTTDTKYVHVKNIDHIWDDNHSDLKLEEKGAEGAWEQRWVLGHPMDPADKRSILRHYGDGRCVDVHGWQFSDGGNMGTEHSAHAECKGIRYTVHCEEAAE